MVPLKHFDIRIACRQQIGLPSFCHIPSLPLRRRRRGRRRSRVRRRDGGGGALCDGARELVEVPSRQRCDLARQGPTAASATGSGFGQPGSDAWCGSGAGRVWAYLLAASWAGGVPAWSARGLGGRRVGALKCAMRGGGEGRR
ncbi:hypothetical protein VPH35_069233 [Triticum aestivum]